MKLNIGYYPMMDMFLALRQEYSNERFRPFNGEMTTISGKFTVGQRKFIDELGLLTNGYLSTLEELLNIHLHSYSSPESVLIDIISEPTKLFIKDIDKVSDERILSNYKDAVERENNDLDNTTISNNLVNLWKDIFSTASSKYSKEVFDKVLEIKNNIKDNDPLSYLCEVSDRVYLKDNQLHFNIKPSLNMDVKDIDNIIIMPSIFASRDLTFWYSEKNIIFFIGLDTKKLDECDPSDMLLLSTSALNDKTRLKMLRYMLNENCSASELADYLKMNASTISRHLKLFKDTGFVDIYSQEKNTIIYSVNKTNIDGALSQLKDYLNIK